MKHQHSKWHRVLCLALALLLVCGCADVGEPPKPEDNTAPTNPFTAAPVAGNMQTAYPTPSKKSGGYLAGFTVGGVAVTMDPVTIPAFEDETIQPAQYNYTGKGPLDIDFYLNPSLSEGQEYGITLFLNAVPQPFSVGACGNIAPTDSLTMEYRFDYHGDGKCIAFPLSFTPVCGKAGEEMQLSIVLTESPSFRAKNEADCNSRWLRSTSFSPTSLYMEVDAPSQQTVDALKIDNGHAWDKSMYDPTVSTMGVLSLRSPGLTFGDLDVMVFHPSENGALPLVVSAGVDYTIPCLIGIRLDGELTPVFEGKYYAEVIMPKCEKQVGVPIPDPVILNYTLDPSLYPDARTVQAVMMPIPVPGTDYEWGVTRDLNVLCSDVAWIEYENE